MLTCSSMRPTRRAVSGVWPNERGNLVWRTWPSQFLPGLMASTSTPLWILKKKVRCTTRQLHIFQALLKSLFITLHLNTSFPLLITSYFPSFFQSFLSHSLTCFCQILSRSGFCKFQICSSYFIFPVLNWSFCISGWNEDLKTIDRNLVV